MSQCEDTRYCRVRRYSPHQVDRTRSLVYQSLARRYVRVGSKACDEWNDLQGCRCDGTYYPGIGMTRPVVVVNPPGPAEDCPKHNQKGPPQELC